jgi:hypothetical protein
MWIFMTDAMISVVQKPRDRLLTVRARVKGDIERIFPTAEVVADAGTDYKYRARIPRQVVALAMFDAVMAPTYPNFKGAVADDKRHDAYLHVWSEMMAYQRQMAQSKIGGA